MVNKEKLSKETLESIKEVDNGDVETVDNFDELKKSLEKQQKLAPIGASFYFQQYINTLYLQSKSNGLQ